MLHEKLVSLDAQPELIEFVRALDEQLAQVAAQS